MVTWRQNTSASIALTSSGNQCRQNVATVTVYSAITNSPGTQGYCPAAQRTTSPPPFNHLTCRSVTGLSVHSAIYPTHVSAWLHLWPCLFMAIFHLIANPSLTLMQHSVMATLSSSIGCSPGYISVVSVLLCSCTLPLHFKLIKCYTNCTCLQSLHFDW